MSHAWWQGLQAHVQRGTDTTESGSSPRRDGTTRGGSVTLFTETSGAWRTPPRMRRSSPGSFLGSSHQRRSHLRHTCRQQWKDRRKWERLTTWHWA